MKSINSNLTSDSVVRDLPPAPAKSEATRWECHHGTPDEDHNWKLIVGDSSVGEGDYMECKECGETREATEQDVRDAYNDCDYDH